MAESIKELRELIKEFTEQHCPNCNAYFVCGGEVGGCEDFENFKKKKIN
jgi:radical SAM protein with 4Fe4S-binding SPASM domain